MLSFLAWWVAVQILSLAAFPLAFRLLRCLPDRGYAAAKPLGIILISYCFWITASLGLTGNELGSLFLLALCFMLVGLGFGLRQRFALAEFVRSNLRYLLLVEAVFLVVFAWFALLRAYAPDIAATEKQFELAFLNGVSRSPFYPPPDPWLSGHVMNYYYFGWVNVHLLDQLTGTPNATGFNLGTPLSAALAAVTILGLVYGLVRRPDSSGSRRRSFAFGILAVLLLLVASNLEGLFEWLSIHNIGSAGLYDAVGVNGLTTGKTSSTWYPNEFWFWWRATRMGSSYNIMEFPYFSFLLGDLHPHVMVLPFALLALTFAWNLHAGDQPLDGHWWRRNPLFLGVLAILLGALGLLNAWDQPTAFVVLFAIALLTNARRLGGLDWPALRASVLFVLPFVLLAILLYLPYWGVFEKTDIVGVSAIVVSALAAGDARDSMATPPLHLLLFWGPLLWLVLSFLAVYLQRTRSIHLSTAHILLPPIGACLPLFLWAIAVAAHLGTGGLVTEITTRSDGLLTELILTIMLFLSLAALVREAMPPDGRPSDRPVLFALLAISVGILWILGAELFYVVEAFASLRYNTVFKLWFQAWALLSIGGGFGCFYVSRDWRLPFALLRPPQFVWATATAVLLLAALAYPLTASPNRANAFSGTPTLNGLASFQRTNPADYAAAAWLSANVQGTPVVLEAEGGGSELAGNFSALGGRISELTGLPTVLAWLEHEEIHHGVSPSIEARSRAIRTIYTSTDSLVTHDLLQRYGVRYVVVGNLERRAYGDAGLAKFAQMGAAVYRGPGITIYDVAQPPPSASEAPPLRGP